MEEKLNYYERFGQMNRPNSVSITRICLKLKDWGFNFYGVQVFNCCPDHSFTVADIFTPPALASLVCFESIWLQL
jgi:hypothetical protein